MAEVIERDIAAGPDGAIVERKVVPRRKGISPFGAFLVVAFVATCAVVFFGDRLGLGTRPSARPGDKLCSGSCAAANDALS